MTSLKKGVTIPVYRSPFGTEPQTSGHKYKVRPVNDPKTGNSFCVLEILTNKRVNILSLLLRYFKCPVHIFEINMSHRHTEIYY